MNPQDLIAQFQDLFAGRTDVFAEAVPHKSNPNKVQYIKVERELTDKDYLNHLKGTSLGIGVYPIVEGCVKWLAVDFDGTSFEQAFQEAQREAALLQRKGIQVYLERSRSGLGVHLWVFLDDWIDANKARNLLIQTLELDADSFDRIYPVQSDTRRGGYGNLLALPFHGTSVEKGNSVFVDDHTGVAIGRREFLTDVKRNKVAFIESLIAALEETTKRTGSLKIYSASTDPDAVMRPEPIEGVLKLISPFGCPFMRYAWENRRVLKEPLWYAAIGQASCFKGGRDFAHLLSRDYDGYNPKEVDEKYNHAVKNPPVSYKYLREKFPQVPLDNIQHRFPFEVAKQSLLDIVSNTSEQMEPLGSFEDDLAYIQKLNDGTMSSGATWGIPGMDEISLLRPSELTIVGGHPSMGKSWLLTAAARGQAEQGVIPFVFSPETARTPLRQRLLANVARVELMALRGERDTKLTVQELARIELASKHLEKLPIYVDYTSLSVEDVILQVERTILKYRIPFDAKYVIWFDYLQFGFSKPGEDEREKISRMASEFKILSKTLEHPVVALSQLIRTEEGNEKPSQNWFAGSSSIERNMDGGIILTGQRIAGDYAPRTITSVKQREGRGNSTKDFTLNQGFGEWRPVIYSAELHTKDLLGDLSDFSPL